MTPDYVHDVDAILRFLPEDFEALAVEHDVLRVQHGNAKIKTAKELMWIFFVHAGLNLPLRQTAAAVREANGPSVSPMRIHKKMIRSASYLQDVMQRLASIDADRSSERWLGYRVLTIDATTLCGPGATGADARIHSVMELASLRISKLEVTDDRGGETLARFEWDPGDLVVGDRGYSHANGIEKVVRQGGAVLVRLNWHSLPLRWSDSEKADVLAWLRTLKGNAVHERAAYVPTPKNASAVNGRVIARRLKADELAQAEARLRREHSAKDITPEMLESARYMVLFTTARLSASDCVELYRLRWQIELQFKRWKSLCGFDRLPNYRDDTILAWLYLKLILGIILERIASPTTEAFSPEGNNASCGHAAA
jgi:hypothetical protein